MSEPLDIPGGKILSFDNDHNSGSFDSIPLEVENSARCVWRFFSITSHTRFWEFLGLCSRECVQRQGVIIASLRGQLKGLHRARRTRERELEAQVKRLESELGRCQVKFVDMYIDTSLAFPKETLDSPSRLG